MSNQVIEFMRRSRSTGGRMGKLLASTLAVISCLLVSVGVNAATISGGVVNSDLISRDMRDGAQGINFIDLGRPITGSGWITSWSIYAQQNSAAGWQANTESRQVGLIIFQANGAAYDVVGYSPLETIGTNGWNQVHVFADLGTGIHVNAGDFIGWYYPNQGSFDAQNPGGVIGFSWTPGSKGDDIRWNTPWGNSVNAPFNVPQSEYTGTGYTFNSGYNLGAYGDGSNGRIYSINVSGTTQAPVPIPAGVFLLAPSFVGLAAIKRRFRK